MPIPITVQKTRAPLTVAVLVGSVRVGSNTAKAAAFIAAELKSGGRIIVDYIDPREVDLVVPGRPGQDLIEARLNEALRERVRIADGVVVVTPEYDGSYSSITKILIECLGYPSVLAGKPVTILGVASGRIGAVRAIAHLRSLLFNVGALVLPTSPSVAQVHQCFDVNGLCIKEDVRLEIQGAARELETFASAFRLAP